MCKFIGCYDAAVKEKYSGQNVDDVMKMAHAIFYNDYNVKFTLEHEWLELRHDQKWCGASSTKENLKSKRRKIDDQSAQSSTYAHVGEDEEMGGPVVAKSAKAKSKRSVSKATSLEEEGKQLEDFQSMWEIRQNDYLMKEKLSKQKLLDSLFWKTKPLTEIEIALKNKLINDMLAS